MAEKCTNTSSPVERWINPYPFAPLNHFTVPFSLTKKLLSPRATNDSSAACLFALPWNTGRRYRTPPRRDGKNFCGVAACRRTAPTEKAPRHSGGRLPATKYGGAAKTKARYRTANTETSTLLLLRQPGPAGEAPDNSRKIPLGKSEVCRELAEGRTLLRGQSRGTDPER